MICSRIKRRCELTCRTAASVLHREKRSLVRGVLFHQARQYGDGIANQPLDRGGARRPTVRIAKRRPRRHVHVRSPFGCRRVRRAVSQDAKLSTGKQLPAFLAVPLLIITRCCFSLE